MTQPDEPHVPDLIDFKKDELHASDASDAFHVPLGRRAETLWLANFASQNTRDAYQRSVASFIATIGLTSPDDLYQVRQAHVLAWRASMEAAELSQATIASRLSALSSLYKHLTDEQLTPTNPVTGVRRPKTGNAGMGAGKSLPCRSARCGPCSMRRTRRPYKVCATGRCCMSTSMSGRAARSPAGSRCGISATTPSSPFSP